MTIELMPDISHYQPILTVGVAKAVKSVACGIMFKATEGTGFSDPHFGLNVSAARAAGLAWGAYHYTNQGYGAAQADHFLDRVLAAGQPAFLMMDWEKGDRATADDFLTRLRATADGIVVAQYIGAWGRGHGGAFPNLPTMVPHYGPAELEDYYKPTNAPLAAWQYSNGVTNGTKYPKALACGGDTSIVYEPALLGLTEGDDVAFSDFKAGWKAFRQGERLPAAAEPDFAWGYSQAEWASSLPKPGSVEPHSHPATVQVGKNG